MLDQASQTILAYDLGGTKIASAIVTGSGRILKELKEPVDLKNGPEGLIRQMAEMGKKLLASNLTLRKKTRRVGIASAGPLDPNRGTLLDPTNFSKGDPAWKKLKLAQGLSKHLKLPVVLENDAAAAVLGEHWKGAAKKNQNAMVLTLGTGLGTGMLCNGELVRAGRGLHPEGGHLILNADDRTAPCGCGNFGCAEAYLSGKNFFDRFLRKISEKYCQNEMTHLKNAKDVADWHRENQFKTSELQTTTQQAFEEYAHYLALAIHNYAVIYAPEKVILTGSFAESSDLFLPETLKRLEPLLARRRSGVDLFPKVCVSPLKNRSGILGAAYVALQSSAQKKQRKA